MINISVIIPVYNTEKYLRECLDSVFSQTLLNIEIICIDDGSSDHSLDILFEYSEKHSNLIVICQENKGAGLARNRGMECASGKYFCFMDSDDYYLNHQALERLFIVAEENNALICGGNVMLVSGNDKREWRNWFTQNEKRSFLDCGNFYFYQRYIFRSEVIKRNNIKFPPYRRYQDPPFLIKAMIKAQNFYVVKDPVYAYRREHRRLRYTLDMTIDLLKGIRDCFKLAAENNILKAYDEYLKSVLLKYGPAFYKYADQNTKEVWKLIDEINAIQKKWTGETSNVFSDRESMKEYIKRLRVERERMLIECRAAENIVIYGAGIAGKFFIENYEHECHNIVGFAVSEKNSVQSFIKGYPVKKITEYNRDDLIIVAVGSNDAQEILENLNNLSYKKVFYVKYEGLKLLESIDG